MPVDVPLPCIAAAACPVQGLRIMTDLVMRKRPGTAGEVGLFVDSPVFEEDFGHVKMNAEVQVKATTPRSLRQLKFAWALATKIADACDWVETKEDCMDFMLIEAKHFRRIYDPLRGVAILKPKPTNFGAMDGTEYTRLLKRITYVAVTIMVPGMDDSALKAGIEAMIGPDLPASAPEPKPVRAPRQRKPTADPQPQEPAGGTAGNSDPAAPSDTPQDEGAAGPSAPTNEAEYIAACRAWIVKQGASHEESRMYFEGNHHVALRQKCGVGIGVRNMLRRELAKKYERKGK